MHGIYRFRTADRQADWGSGRYIILGIWQVHHIGDLEGILGIWKVYWGSGSYIGDLEGTVYYSSPLLGEYISRKNCMYILVVHFARFTYLDEQNSKFFINERVL